MKTDAEKLTEAIISIAEKAKESIKPGEAMQLSQAALNLAHTLSILKNS